MAGAFSIIYALRRVILPSAHEIPCTGAISPRRCGFKSLLLLQKFFTVDFLTKKRKVNEGEVPQYYVEHSHEPIITPEEFDKVQRYEKAKAQLERLRTTKAAREARAEAIGAFMFEVQEPDTITEFDEKLWLTIIDTITVHADGRMTFKFRGGKTLTSY